MATTYLTGRFYSGSLQPRLYPRLHSGKKLSKLLAPTGALYVVMRHCGTVQCSVGQVAPTFYVFAQLNTKRFFLHQCNLIIATTQRNNNHMSKLTHGPIQYKSTPDMLVKMIYSRINCVNFCPHQWYSSQCFQFSLRAVSAAYEYLTSEGTRATLEPASPYSYK